MASGSQNMTTFKAKGLTSIANIVDTSNFIFLKSTTLTADQLGDTVSLSLNAVGVTGAAMTNHSLFLNAGVGSGLGTPFQLQIPDSSHLYIYKRWYSSNAWSGWSKISAGHADDAAKWTTARTITLTGSVTGSVSIDGSGNVSLATTTNHNHDWRYPQNHITSFAFTGNNQPLSRYITFDLNAPAGGPGGWINGFMSVHNDYLASYIVQVHRSDDWYLGWNQYSNGTVNAAPVWRKIIHSGNIGSQSVNYATSAGNADKVDNYHASSFYIHDKVGATSTNGADDLWGLTGSRSFHNALPDGLSGIYTYGQLISFSTDDSARFQIYASHYGSEGYSIHFRTGWGNDKKKWRRIWSAGDSVTNAVWNDLGECRKSDSRESGYAIAPSGTRTFTRLEPGARIISDTWGFLLGDENDTEKAPVAIAGRVLAYPLHDKSYYEVGDAVCAAEGGKIDKMTREEIKEYPDRIIGIVNEIPDYDIWEPSREGGGREPIHTNGRIWIDVR